MESWLLLIKEIGPFLGIMFFFIWRDYRREERLSKRVAYLEKFITSELIDLIERTNKALENVGKS